MNSDIEKMLRMAAHAPSADNMQPWRFAVRDDTISVLAEIEKPDWYFDKAMTHISCGASIENILISAKALGYRTHLSLFPQEHNERFIADIVLEKTEVSAPDPLSEVIPARVTNRTFYKCSSIPEHIVKDILTTAAIDDGTVSTSYIADRKKIKILARGLSAGIQMQLSNKEIHNYFYNHIRWTPEEIARTKNGIPLKALDLNTLTTIEFKMMRSWTSAKLASYLGAPRMAAQSYAQRYLCSGGFLVFLTSGNTPHDFVTAGRSMQRAWLAATTHHLGVQPIAGTYIGQGTRGENLIDLEMLSDRERKIIEVGYRDIQKGIALEGKTLAMVLRIGVAQPPKVRSIRNDPMTQ